MSVTIAKNAIRGFLLSGEPEVLCIKGKWGTGKTYAWNEVLKSLNGKMPFTSYSYVSLFGLNSLDAVKRAIFENSINTNDIGVEPSIDTFQTNTLSVAANIGRKSLGVLRQFPYANDFARGFDAVSFLSIRRKIICIDDLERRGDGLSIRDVLGLVSFLREQRRCKIVLILNDGELNDAGGDFNRYFEKVVDLVIDFSPTAEECANIALNGPDKLRTQMRQDCVALGVSNIRVMKQIERLANMALPHLRAFDPTITQQAIQTLVLLGWSKHTTDVPTIEFIRDKHGKSFYGLTKSNSLPEKEKAWDSILNKYGFTRMDELDRLLLDGVERGYFDEDGLVTEAKKLDQQKKASDLEGSFSSAWRLYHDTFDNNEAEVISSLEISFAKAINQISPIDLNGTVRLLKDLGHPERAKKLIEDYLTARKGEQALFDLSRSSFSGDVTDPDVIEAFGKQHSHVVDDRNPAEVLLRMAKNSGWNPEDIELLSKVSVDGYCQIFKSAGENAGRIIGACLLFSQVNNADDKMKLIAKNAIDALKKIGAESAINRRRVQRYISFPEPAPEAGD